MTWEPVPFVIGNGAIHSEGVFRTLAFQALNGNEGVLGAGDLKVSALGTPGGFVNVATGAAAMIGRGAAQLAEMYAARMPTVDTVPIGATGSGAGRSDLIIARIEDPNVAGSPWAQPSSVAAGPYVFTRVISGVPNTTRTVAELNLGYTAVALARVDIPVSTSAITQAMIVDLRKVANPRTDRRAYTNNPTTTINLTAAAPADWFGTWTVDVPLWATRAVVILTIGGVKHTRLSSSAAGTATGSVRVALGSLFTQTAGYNLETTLNNSTSRNMFGAADTVALPLAVRGTNQTLRIQGAQTGGNVPVAADVNTFATVDVEFQEGAV